MQVHKPIKSFYVLLFALFFLIPAHSATDSLSYQTEVPVNSYSSEDWQKAIAPALQQVLTKITGNANITKAPTVRKAMSKPNTLVQTFTYTSHTDETGKKILMLQINFSPKAIDILLQNADLPDTVGNTQPDLSSTSTPSASSTVSQNTTPQTINMVITGIRNLQDYTALLDFVRHLEGVMEVNSKQTQGDRVLLLIKSTNTLDDLAKLIENDGRLLKEPLTGTVASGASILNYRWVVDGASVASTEASDPGFSP